MNNTKLGNGAISGDWTVEQITRMGIGHNQEQAKKDESRPMSNVEREAYKHQFAAVVDQD